MSKYDFEIDLSDSSSTGLILKDIKPRSTVLEFGCATGRMTHYMKESLACDVYIVEYEQSAFDVAIEYAADGVCDDIMTLSWLEKFKDVRFDAVMFADVLEHLPDPALILTKVKEILAPDGKVYFSVPNVTHNDILLKEYSDHFDYTKVGLLDDTHIHFWGLQNIEPFIEGCGYVLDKLQATYCDTGYTEQFNGETLPYSQQLLNHFNVRTAGNIYQFVVFMKAENPETKALPAEEKINIKSPFLKSHLYYDYGHDFDADSVTVVNSDMVSPFKYSTHYIVKNLSDVKRIKFDPVELQGCLISYISIRQGDRELVPHFNENIKTEFGYFLINTDPFFYVDVEDTTTEIIINLDIILPGPEYETKLTKAAFSLQTEAYEKHVEILTKNNDINVLKQSQTQLKAEYEAQSIDNMNLTEERDNLRIINKELSDKSTELYNMTVKLSEDIASQQAMLQAKLSDISRLEQEIIRYNEIISVLNNRISERFAYEMDKEMYILSLEQQAAAANHRVEMIYSKFEKLKLISLYRFLRKVKNKLFRK